MPESRPASDEAQPAWWNVETNRCQSVKRQPGGERPKPCSLVLQVGAYVTINCLCDLG